MAASGYIPVQSSSHRKKTFSSYCATFKAWKGGDDSALDQLLAQGYDRLFMPKAERVSLKLPLQERRHPKNLLESAWSTISADGRDCVESFPQLLAQLQVTLERVAQVPAV